MKKYNVMALLTKPRGLAVVVGVACVTAVLAAEQQPASYFRNKVVEPSCKSLYDSGSCVYTTYQLPLYLCESCWFYNCGCTCTNSMNNTSIVYEGVCAALFRPPEPPSTNWIFVGYECSSMLPKSTNAVLTQYCYNPNN